MRHVSSIVRPLTFLSVAAFCSGCVWHRHDVGMGGTGTAEVSERQFYVMFGLIEVNEVDCRRLAPDLTSYTIETKYGLLDLLLAPLLLPITMTSRTVTVKT